MEKGSSSLKEKAMDFLTLAAAGKSREAFHLYVGNEFKHHNVYFKGDADTLMKAMEENAAENPDKIFEIQRVLEDQDHVAVHSRIRQNREDHGAAVVHIFRFSNNRIAEIWDIGQEVPPKCINEYGMF